MKQNKIHIYLPAQMRTMMAELAAYRADNLESTSFVQIVVDAVKFYYAARKRDR